MEHPSPRCLGGLMAPLFGPLEFPSIKNESLLLKDFISLVFCMTKRKVILGNNSMIPDSSIQDWCDSRQNSKQNGRKSRYTLNVYVGVSGNDALIVGFVCS
jgi:hypothetical protein